MYVYAVQSALHKVKEDLIMQGCSRLHIKRERHIKRDTSRETH